MSARVPENKDAPCNICGRGWPYHEPACAYVGSVCDLTELREQVAWLKAALIRCAELSGEGGEAVAAARSGAMKQPRLDVWAVDAVKSLRDDYDELLGVRA